MDLKLESTNSIYGITEGVKHEIGGIDFFHRHIRTVLPFTLFSIVATILGALGYFIIQFNRNT